MELLKKAIAVLLLAGMCSLLHAQPNPGIYRSEDGGKTWSASAAGFPELGMVTAFLEHKDKILAATFDQGLFASTNDGKDWANIGKHLPDGIRALGNRGEVLFAASWRSGVSVSFDGGQKWQERNFGLTDLEVNTLFTSGNFVFAGTTTGIFYTWNDGQTWMRIFSDLQVTGFTQFGTHLYAATPAGVLQSDDYGRNWKIVLPCDGVRDIKSNKYGVFALSYRQGIFKSNDGQGAWVSCTLGLPESSGSILSIAQLGHLLLAGYSDGLFLSITGGGNWMEAEKTFPANTAIGILLGLKCGVLLASRTNGGC